MEEQTPASPEFPTQFDVCSSDKRQDLIEVWLEAIGGVS